MSSVHSIDQLVNTLPPKNLTVHILQALDFVVPGAWQNRVNYEDTIRAVTGEHDGYAVWHIRQRSLELYHDISNGYQRTIWLYRTIDKADSALGAAAMANRVGNKVNFLSFLSKMTPKPDTAQVIDLSLKLVVELLAFCQLNGIAMNNISGFANALQHYRGEALMRMAALICIDGVIPLGPDFTDIVLSKLHAMNAAELEKDSSFKPLSGIIPGENTAGKLNFITESFGAVEDWIDQFLESRGLSRETILASLKQFVDIADDKLDYVAAFLDMTTNYYEHTGIQTVARCLIERAASEVRALPDASMPIQPQPQPTPSTPPSLPGPPVTNASGSIDLTPFYAVDGRYAQLKQQYNAGVLTQQALVEQLQQMMVQDAQGGWWSKEPQSGHWYAYDAASNAWVHRTPPGYPPQVPLSGGSPPSPVTTTPPAPASSPGSSLFQQTGRQHGPPPQQAASSSPPTTPGSSLFQKHAAPSPADAPPAPAATPTPAAPGSSLFQRYAQSSDSSDTQPDGSNELDAPAPGSSLFQRYTNKSSDEEKGDS